MVVADVGMLELTPKPFPESGGDSAGWVRCEGAQVSHNQNIPVIV